MNIIKNKLQGFERLNCGQTHELKERKKRYNRDKDTHVIPREASRTRAPIHVQHNRQSEGRLDVSFPRKVGR